MLSFKGGVAIATVKAADGSTRTLYLRDSNIDPVKLLEKQFKADLKDDLDQGERRKLYKAIRSSEPPSDEKLVPFYELALTNIQDKDSFNSLDASSSKLEVMPRKDIVEKLYVSGVSGSGKSTYVGKYLKHFKKMFPDDQINVFSSVDEDEALDVHDPVRVDLDEAVDDPYLVQDFESSISVFDDTNTIRDKMVRDAVNAVQAELIEIGRHYQARVIVTSHILCNYKQTRQILNEATSVTFFPNSSGKYHINNFLRTHAGLDRDQIERVFLLPSRWVTIYRTFPSYIIWEKGVSLLSEF